MSLRLQLSEENLEQLSVDELTKLHYQSVDLRVEFYPNVELYQRETRSDVVFKETFQEMLLQLNEIPDTAVDRAIEEIIRDRSSLSFVNANKELYNYLKNGVKVTATDEKGVERDYVVNLIDWVCPENNHFLVARQMNVSGDMYKRILLSIDHILLFFLPW
ncbi:hypothetical protein ES703_17706 [subsurface metagenome]